MLITCPAIIQHLDISWNPSNSCITYHHKQNSNTLLTPYVKAISKVPLSDTEPIPLLHQMLNDAPNTEHESITTGNPNHSVTLIAIEDNIKSKNETYTDATEHENNYHHKNDKSKNDKNYETDNHKNNKNYKNDDDAKNYETDKNENNRMDWSVFDMVLS